MMKQEQDIKKETLLDIAKKMVVAARTAPKGRGIDHMTFMIAEKSDIERIAGKMKEIAEKEQLAGFARDADNILQTEVMVLLGTKYAAVGLKKCGLCGYQDCEEKTRHPESACVFNTGDLGIAIGSAVSIAADCRVDNRIMYSVGLAVQELGIFSSDIKLAFGIPLSATSKSPFFDRK
ncbi:MAG: ferredoxin [Candidatus Omnitrophica bacterium]|nr:ferredoxin [Candidatus Omnitrophota bacterium]